MNLNFLDCIYTTGFVPAKPFLLSILQQSSLLDIFLGYEENEVLRILFLFYVYGVI